ncbi:hypothetical protein SISNIDRAFT_325611 [Sistotremastrum niveocremeum HHB9708]|uniref:Spondin domain-containing protein n=1 Tax=Sistotremastrum niveocremeum HHB9708 TaxID=1314777 RepID=A0A164X9M7_9AGAM|nr:hypothetical protein SISNIDRAFT_325611 [Sistotremastrum niveocremeum HHB9708]
MQVLLLVALLASSVFALIPNPVYEDEFGTQYSHPLIDGKVLSFISDIKPLSNRDLLAAGLRPRSPKFVQDAVAKRVPTPVDFAARELPSQLPIPSSAHIIVKNAGGATLGFIARGLTIFDTFPITQDISQAAVFTPSANNNGFYDLAVASEPSPFIGIVTGVAGDNFESASPSYGFMSPVPESSNPNSNNPFDSPGESQIWQINPVTLSVTAQWRNGGTDSPLTIFHDISFGDLDFAGDLGAFSDAFGDTVEPVTLTLVVV